MFGFAGDVGVCGAPVVFVVAVVALGYVLGLVGVVVASDSVDDL